MIELENCSRNLTVVIPEGFTTVHTYITTYTAAVRELVKKSKKEENNNAIFR